MKPIEKFKRVRGEKHLLRYVDYEIMKTLWFRRPLIKVIILCDEIRNNLWELCDDKCN